MEWIEKIQKMDVWLSPENLSWSQRWLLLIMLAMAFYATFHVIALLWRVPKLVLAKQELAEAQKAYYEAKTEEIKKAADDK